VALRDNYVKPQFTDDDTFEIVDGRHPMGELLALYFGSTSDLDASRGAAIGPIRPQLGLV
jgi:hypothetical protein